MKQYYKIALYSCLIELATFPLRAVSFMACAVITFILFFIFQYFISKKYKEKLNTEYLLLFSLIGAFLLQMPIRLWSWSSTLISLPDFLFHLLGIVMGYLFYKSAKMYKVIVLSLSLLSSIFIYFKGYDMWIHKLNHGTFTGKIEITIAPDFQFVTEQGDTLSLADFSGKYVVVDFWFTRCGVCFEKFPKVQSLYDKYKDNSSVAVFSINARLENESDNVAFETIRNEGYSFPVYKLDMDNPVLHQLGVNGYPTVLIFDKKGKLVFRGSIEQAKTYIGKII